MTDEGILLRTIRVNDKECERCYQCVRYCPNNALRVDKGIFTHYPHLCSYCGTCTGFCTNLEINEPGSFD